MFAHSLRNIISISSMATKAVLSNTNSAGNLFQRSFHILSWPKTNANLVCQPKLLTPIGNPQLNQVAGFKVKGVVKRRCRDCYLIAIEGRVYNLCPTHPRHKQMSMKKKAKSEYIVTHATQHKIRPW